MHIIADILISAKRKNSKTRILHDANLNFNRLQKYLSFLDELKLLTADKFDGKTYYRTTEKGDRFLENFQEIKWLLKKEKKVISSHNFEDRTAPRGLSIP